MSIILRMNDLPLSANSLDIRRFFRGIRIPDGGVHIIGGPESSVFIAFNDDDAASEAMKMTGQMIMNQPVRIGLSSRNEMKNFIKTLFECAILQENGPGMPGDCPPSGQNQSSPNRCSSPPSRYPGQPPLQSGPLNLHLPLHSSPIGNPLHGPPYEVGPHVFDQQTNYAGPIIPPGHWNDAGPSNSSPYRVGPPSKHQPLFATPLPLSPSSNTDNARRLTVEVHGLPLGVNIQDLMEFFYPLCTEDNIKLVEDERNFPTGVALIRLLNPIDFNHALDLNGKPMGDNIIWIKPLIEPQLNRPGLPGMGLNSQSIPIGPPLLGTLGPPLIGKLPPPPPQMGPGLFYGPPDGRYDVPFDPGFAGPQGPMPIQIQPGQKPVVYMKGLPFELCTNHDIQEFFRPLHVVHIELENDNRGRLAGNAYVEFATLQDYNIACAEYHMRHMGSRYIEVLPINTERVRSYCIHIKNIPPCSSDEVGKFLQSFNFRPTRIHHNPILNEAYAEFLSAKEQIKAVENLHGKFWDGEAVSVTRIPFQVMMKKMTEAQSMSPESSSRIQNHRPGTFRERSPPSANKRKRPRSRNNNNNARRNTKPNYVGNYNPFEDKKSVLIALECDSRAQVEDFCEFFENYGIEPEMVQIQDNNSGTINARIAFHNHFDAKDAFTNMSRELFLGNPIILHPA